MPTSQSLHDSFPCISRLWETEIHVVLAKLSSITNKHNNTPRINPYCCDSYKLRLNKPTNRRYVSGSSRRSHTNLIKKWTGMKPQYPRHKMLQLDSNPTPIQERVMAKSGEALSPGQSVLYQDFNQQSHTAWDDTQRCYPQSLRKRAAKTVRQNVLSKAPRVVDEENCLKNLLLKMKHSLRWMGTVGNPSFSLQRKELSFPNNAFFRFFKA